MYFLIYESPLSYSFSILAAAAAAAAAESRTLLEHRVERSGGCVSSYCERHLPYNLVQVVRSRATGLLICRHACATPTGQPAEHRDS